MTESSIDLLEGLLRTGLMLSVAAGVVLVMFRVFRIASPSVRRFACVVVLLQGWFFVRWPVEVAILPESKTEISGDKSQSGARSPGSADSILNFGRSLTDNHTKIANTSPVDSAALKRVTAPTVTSVARTTNGSSNPSDRVPLFVWIVCLWMTGILEFCLRSLWVYVRFLRELPPALNEEADWESEWITLQKEAGLEKCIPLYVTEQTGPMLCRWPRGYRLIVPADLWKELSASQRHSILRHELAHVLRRDVWKSLAVRVLALPHWFNPLAWRIVREFDECAEWACDEAARSAIPAGVSNYARALLRLSAAESPFSPLHPAARGRGLVLRIRRLLIFKDLEDSRMKKFSITMLVLGFSLFSLMRIQLVAEESEKTESENPTAVQADSSVSVLRVRVPSRGPAPKIFFGTGVNSDVGVTGQIVLEDDDLSTATKDGLLRDDDCQSDELDRAQKRVGNDPSINSGHSRKEVVVDINYLFKNLDEFERERQKIKAEVIESQKEFEMLIKDIRSLQARLKKRDFDGLNGGSKESDVVIQLLEREIARKKSEMEMNEVNSQQKFLRQQALIYEKIYNKIRAEVAKYAREHGIKLVRRIDRVAQREKEIEASDPSEILRRINQQVVYIESSELDITDEILKRLQPKKKAQSEDETRN